ncbi:MAG: efflux RND transporter periplasmic adaptor subunit [Gemmatimonadota bacterium]|nr:efflux RND transporter periplasmic adaptor subunit [Gemmatimonadota bacterium]
MSGQLQNGEKRPTWTRRARWASAIGAALLVVLIVIVVRWRGSREARATLDAGRSTTTMPGMPGMTAASGASARGNVELSASQMRELGITFGTVERRMLTDEIRTIGTVSVNEGRVAQVAPKFAGFAERLRVDFTGASVARGQPMIELYSPEVIAAEQELLSASALGRAMQGSAVPGVPASSTDLVAAARMRLRLWDVPDAEVDEVLRSGRPRRTVTLFAPIAGVVTEKTVVRGQSVPMGQSLYTIADLSEVWVIADVREADAGRIRVGATTDVELTSMPGRTWKGHVSYLYPTLDAQNRTVRARVVVPNSNGLLKPGMYTVVRLLSPSHEALTAPTSAVVRTGSRSVVFVDLGSGRLAPRAVTIGRSVGNLTEILAGAEPGQRVVTSAQFLLSSESNLAEVMRGMITQTGAGDQRQVQDMNAMPGMKATPAQRDSSALREKGADMKDMPGMTPSTAKSPEKKP